jgi:hypothetical protein
MDGQEIFVICQNYATQIRRAEQKRFVSLSGMIVVAYFKAIDAALL